MQTQRKRSGSKHTKLVSEVNCGWGGGGETRTKSWAQHKRREKKQSGLKLYSHGIFTRVHFLFLI